MGIVEALVAMSIGWGINWWTTPKVKGHIIEYKPKTELLEKYNPKGDCKEDDKLKCITGFPRVVITQEGYIEFKDRLIDTRSELKQCIAKINSHNNMPVIYEEKSLW